MNDVEERGPLGEDDDFGEGITKRNLDDLHKSFGLGRLFISVDFFVFRLFNKRIYETIAVCKRGTTKGAFLLEIDGALNTFFSEGVLAGCDDRVMEFFETNGTFFLIIDIQLKKHLESEAILGVENNYVVILKRFQEIGDSVFAELPVVTYLTHAKKNLKDMSVCNLILLVRS